MLGKIEKEIILLSFFNLTYFKTVALLNFVHMTKVADVGSCSHLNDLLII